jgi:hypothetical protein
MPRVVIPKENFPEMDIYTQRYNVRYRVITDNQNNLSAWSPIFEVNPEVIFQPGTIELPGKINIEKIGSSYVGLTWDSVSIYKEVDGDLVNVGELPSYDLWIRWAGNGGANPSNWIYKERIFSTSLNINIPSSYVDSGGTTRAAPKYMYAEVYRPGRPIIRYEQTYEFPQNATVVDITNDFINFGQGHGSSTGTSALYVSATPIGGLTSGNTYYSRTIDYTTIALYPTKNDALANTNKINLTSTGSGTGSFTGFPFRMYDALITTL